MTAGPQTAKPMPPYHEHAPPAALDRWVECAWTLSAASPISPHRVPPDGCIDIIYDPRAGLRAIGTMTTEQRFEYPEGATVAGVRFRPGMAGSILRVPPAELTDTSVPLNAPEWRRELHDAKSIQDAMRILLGKLQPPPSQPNPAQRAIEFLTAANGAADLEYAARQANLSPRQFRRRCLEESGLTPKLLCRVLRFRHASRLVASALRPDWSGLAVEAEYFDQAHLIRDFREFTGETPMAVFSNTGGRGSV